MIKFTNKLRNREQTKKFMHKNCGDKMDIDMIV